MKTYIKFIVISILSSISFLVGAQSKSNNKQSGTYFFWKDIVRFKNKEVLNIPQLTINSIDILQVTISKEIHKKRNDAKSSIPGNLISEGYPDWTISKSVARTKK